MWRTAGLLDFRTYKEIYQVSQVQFKNIYGGITGLRGSGTYVEDSRTNIEV